MDIAKYLKEKETVLRRTTTKEDLIHLSRMGHHEAVRILAMMNDIDMSDFSMNNVITEDDDDASSNVNDISMSNQNEQSVDNLVGWAMFGTIWLQLLYFESQRTDAMLSSLAAKTFLLFMLASLFLQCMQTTTTALFPNRIAAVVRTIFYVGMTAMMVSHINSLSSLYSQPIYLDAIVENYIPSPLHYSSLTVPGFRTIHSMEEADELYQFYLNEPQNAAFSIQSAMQMAVKNDVCVTNLMTFTTQDRFQCEGSKCIQYLRSCMSDPNKKLSIVPIEMVYDASSLIRNNQVLIVNHERKEIEVYSSNGLKTEQIPQYEWMTRAIKNEARAVGYNFLGQKSFGFALVEKLNGSRFAEIGPIYTWWYIESRMLNSHLSLTELDAKLANFIAHHPLAIMEFLKPRIALMKGLPLMSLSFSKPEEQSMTRYRITSSLSSIPEQEIYKTLRAYEMGSQMSALGQWAQNDIHVGLRNLAIDEIRKIIMYHDKIEEERERSLSIQQFGPQEQPFPENRQFSRPSRHNQVHSISETASFSWARYVSLTLKEWIDYTRDIPELFLDRIFDILGAYTTQIKENWVESSYQQGRRFAVEERPYLSEEEFSKTEYFQHQKINELDKYVRKNVMKMIKSALPSNFILGKSTIIFLLEAYRDELIKQYELRYIRDPQAYYANAFYVLRDRIDDALLRYNQ